MLKINLVVQDKKDGSDNCIVKLEKPKNIEKASENEKMIMTSVYNAISKALADLQNENK